MKLHQASNNPQNFGAQIALCLQPPNKNYVVLNVPHIFIYLFSSTLQSHFIACSRWLKGKSGDMNAKALPVEEYEKSLTQKKV